MYSLIFFAVAFNISLLIGWGMFWFLRDKIENRTLKCGLNPNDEDLFWPKTAGYLAFLLSLLISVFMLYLGVCYE